MSEILSILKQDIRGAVSATNELGARGEQIAARFLEASGYRLVVANFKVPIGRNKQGASVTGEIDIVAVDGETLCFVEVKTKSSAAFAEPHASVTTRKQRQITRTARVYRRIFNLNDIPYRYDVVSIIVEQNTTPRVELLKEFWSERKFRKKTWTGDIY